MYFEHESSCDTIHYFNWQTRASKIIQNLYTQRTYATLSWTHTSTSCENTYHDKELKFLKTVREIPVDKVPKNSNIISSHVIYKVKEGDDGSLKIKSRILRQGNKDKEKGNLKTNSSICPPTGIRILLAIATIMKWSLDKIDFTSAFLQNKAVKRDVYVVHPRECRRKSFYWFLLTSANGLVYANAKWQEQCDFLIF